MDGVERGPGDHFSHPAWAVEPILRVVELRWLGSRSIRIDFHQVTDCEVDAVFLTFEDGERIEYGSKTFASNR